MPSPHRSLQAACLLPPLSALALATPALAGLENGEVYANNRFTVGGTTAFATDAIDISVITPDPTADPPLPPTFASARARITGTMTDLELSSSASVVSQFNHFSSNSTALIDFKDNLIVHAEGIEDGTELIVEVAWNVSGEVSFEGPIRSRSKILLEAAGIEIPPDPDTVVPKQSWTRDVSNFVPDVLDNTGEVRFLFRVQEGTPNPGNISLRIVAGVLCGAPGGQRFGDYDSSAAANLTLEFVGATRVFTDEGEELYRWTTNAHSTLDYGMRDDEPPSQPDLTVGPSVAGPEFITLSWETVLGEYYLVQKNIDDRWTTVTEVRGPGGTVNVELFADEAAAGYRLLSRFGNGSPNPRLLPPELRVIEAAEVVRFAWQTNHWENHQLQELNFDGTFTTIDSVPGDGSVVWFDFDPVAPGRVFRVQSTLK